MANVSVLASGLVASVGFNAAAGFAAIRAGVRNVRSTNIWDETTGGYIAAGKVDLPQWWVGLGKLAELAAPAVYECLIAASPVPPDEIPILLIVSEQGRPHRTLGIDDDLLNEIGFRLDVQLHGESHVFAGDRVAAVMAIEHARRLISLGSVRLCIVVGVDSFIDQHTVEHYIQRRRILSQSNSNGFSPGEAACAILVGSDGHAFANELRILGCGLAQETATIESDEPLRADGLSEAIRRALTASGIDIGDTAYRISDLNGEHYRFKEMVLAMLRFERKPRATLYELWHPIEYVGDVGAAVGPLILGLGLHAGQKDYAVGPAALYTLSNDGGERGCLVAQFRSVTGSTA